jgi:hypothetical protein
MKILWLSEKKLFANQGIHLWQWLVGLGFLFYWFFLMPTVVVGLIKTI